MKKTIAAMTAGLALVAAQAATAQNISTAPRVGDRLGATAGESSELVGASLAGLLLAAGAIAFVAVGVSDDDDSDSD